MGDEVSRKMKLLVATGSRADYGHLRPLMKVLLESPALEPTLLVTGSHTLERFGSSVAEIAKDGFPVASRIVVERADDSPAGIAASMALILSAAPAELISSGAQALILYGDRWEMLGLAIAATLSGVPIVHIGGGDTTEGAYDEAFRHSITKMAHLHFPTTQTAARRILCLGEDPASVFTVGSLAIDALTGVTTLSRSEFSTAIGYHFAEKNLLVTYHSETLNSNSSHEVEEFIAALGDISADYGMLITLPGLDTGSSFIHQAFQQFARDRHHVVLASSIGHRNYIAALSLFDVVVGNSSSGVYEAPSLGIRTVNVGERQRGRELAASVETVPCQRNGIVIAINSALRAGRRTVENPYGDGTTAIRIRDALLEWVSVKRTLRKRFFFNSQ
jgi:UDP-hydrolysing UDP-N-acetyl-D-glucosamine 2-epimerase